MKTSASGVTFSFGDEEWKVQKHKSTQLKQKLGVVHCAKENEEENDLF